MSVCETAQFASGARRVEQSYRASTGPWPSMLANHGTTDAEIFHYSIVYRQAPERKLAAQRRPIFYREIRHSDVLNPFLRRSSLMLKSENHQKRAHRPDPSALKIHYPTGPGSKIGFSP
jgi:hypothetical protein